jgi:ABC-type amino acid transport substrate-binding protein
MNGKAVTIVTMSDPPFVKLTSADGAPLEYEGYCIDMISEVARLAGFTYTFVPRTIGELGNGWGGASNDVAAGRTDIFWSTFFLTSSRAAVVDVSSSYMDTGLIIVALANLNSEGTLSQRATCICCCDTTSCISAAPKCKSM